MPEEMGAEETMELGGNISLSGFSVLDRDSMVIVKKIVGNYTRKFSETGSFEKLHLRMKVVHGTEKYELHGMVVDKGKQYPSEITDRNLYFAIDRVFKKIEAMMK
ncbi:MAG: hypothetical protein ABIG95_00590 [Candidatus Woesearchaeota archaeon]